MPVTTRLQARRAAHALRRNLFRLPREIRDGIYKNVLAPRSAMTWNPRGNKFPGDAFPLHVKDAAALMRKKPAYISLLQSCKRIHDEAASLLYNTVEMDLRSDHEPEKALLKLGPRQLKHIKHITIEFRHCVQSRSRWDETPKDTFGAWRAAEILRFLQRVGAMLYTVTLKAPWHHEDCTGSGEPTHTGGCVSLQPLLRDPSIFSNVQSVIFPDYLALCPSRNCFHGSPERNRPLTEAQKAEIVSRLRFQVEDSTSCTGFEPSFAPFPKGFFVLENPRALSGPEDTLLPPCEGEWRDMVEEHLTQLIVYERLGYWYPLANLTG